MIDPFDEENTELVNITSGAIAQADVKDNLLSASGIGQEKLNEFIKEKVTSTKPDIFSTITATKLKTFTRKKLSNKAQTSKGKVVELKNDSKFIARLLAIGQSREIDIANLMMYSLRKFPRPFATETGDLVKTAKVKLLHAIENSCPTCLSEHIPENSALIIDGMVIIQTAKNLPQTFGELARKLIEQVIKTAKSMKASRVDFVVDQYPDISIKSLERTKRAELGSTLIKICNGNQKLPRQFKKFLSLGKNKEALVEFMYRFVFILKRECH